MRDPRKVLKEVMSDLNHLEHLILREQQRREQSEPVLAPVNQQTVSRQIPTSRQTSLYGIAIVMILSSLLVIAWMASARWRHEPFRMSEILLNQGKQEMPRSKALPSAPVSQQAVEFLEPENNALGSLPPLEDHRPVETSKEGMAEQSTQSHQELKRAPISAEASRDNSVGRTILEAAQSNMQIPRTVTVGPAVQAPTRRPADPSPSLLDQNARPDDQSLRLSSNSANPGQPESINPKLIDQVKRQVQANEFAKARSLLLQLPASNPLTAELKSMVIEAEGASKQRRDLLDSVLQKAESALIAGHYITPPGDNVLIHCNRGLSIDPQNEKFLTLKKEIINRVVGQAEDWIRQEKFEQAHSLYSSLDYLSRNDSQFPLPREKIRLQLDKLDFSAYPVIHEHKFGSCSGLLRMNGYVLSFVPSADSGHGFTQPLAKVTITELGETLRIILDEGSYRFQTNLAKGSSENRQSLLEIYQRLTGLIAAAR